MRSRGRMKIYLSHSTGFDFVSDLYKPIKTSSLVKEHEFFFPHDEKEFNTRELLKGFDILIAEVSFPSTGQGIEIGWADSFGIPILAVHRVGAKISSAVPLVTDNIISYGDVSEMISQILDRITR